MRRQAMFLVTLALAAGALAALLATQMLRTPPQSATDGELLRTVSVAVASRDMDAGQRIELADVEMLEWPAAHVPEGYSTSVDEVVGRGLLALIRRNEPLLSSKLASPEGGAGMPILIPEGKRAMSVRVDDVVGVAGWVLPGTRVDVVVTMDRGAQQDEPGTRVVLQNLQVLAAGTSIARSENGEPQQVAVVTLLVAPEEAEQLAMAHSNGRLQLALRNPLDLDSVETRGIRASHIIAGRPGTSRVVRAAPRAATPAQPSGRFEMEIYRGHQRTTSEVEATASRNQGGVQ